MDARVNHASESGARIGGAMTALAGRLPAGSPGGEGGDFAERRGRKPFLSPRQRAGVRCQGAFRPLAVPAHPLRIFGEGELGRAVFWVGHDGMRRPGSTVAGRMPVFWALLPDIS